MSNDVTQRLQRLLLVLSYARQRPGAPLAEVARAVGMSADELRRAIPELSLVGRPPFSPDDLIDIYVDTQDRLHVQYDQALGRPLTLTEEEWLALAIALRSLAASGAGAHAEAAEAVLARLKGLLAGRAGGEALAQRFAVEGADAASRDAVAGRYRVLQAGLDERRAVEIVYYTQSRDELNRRTLRPWALLQVLGAWYAIGHDSLRDDQRIFKLERIREARLTDERFTPPADFDARRALARLARPVSGGGTARIRFRAPLARLIAEEHPAGDVAAQPDGSVILTLAFSHPEWIASWALSFGPAAEVLEPASARAAVAARCRAALALY